MLNVIYSSTGYSQVIMKAAWVSIAPTVVELSWSTLHKAEKKTLNQIYAKRLADLRISFIYSLSLHIFHSSRDLWVKRSSSCGSPLTSCVRTPKYLQWRLLCHQGNYFPQNLDVRVHERDGVEQQACNISLDQSSPSIQDCVQFKAETICQLTKLNMQCFNLLCTEAKHHALMSISAPKFFFFFSLNSFGQLAVTHWWIINREQNMFEDNWKRCHVIKTLLQANSKRLLLELQHGCF